MITKLRVQNFRCLKDVTVELTPFHAFIGPNDSGKSTLLRAIKALSDMAAPHGRADDTDDVVAGAELDATLSTGERFAATKKREWERVVIDRSSRQGPRTNLGSLLDWPGSDAIAPARVLRLDPSAMRMPSALLPEGSKVVFADERGTGLPGVYDALLARGDGSFERISRQLAALFPSVRYLQVPAISAGEKALAIQLVDGTRVPASRMSEGMLYFLAYAAVEAMDRGPIVLVEEPENGLHPSRIRDVVAVLRQVSERGAQVIVATHSPLVINEMAPDEVTLVTRDVEKGTQVRRMRDTARFEERSKAYALGELWLAYADGESEEALLHGGPRPALRGSQG